MPLQVLGQARDLRTSTTVIYAQIPIGEYLALVGSEFDEYSIQRKKEKYRAYDRLKKDIVEGTLLPPITLAVKHHRVELLDRHSSSGNKSELERELSNPGQVNILDGLQRTYVLKELVQEQVQFKTGQTLLLEFWLEKELRHLIYRIIVLNAGRKPMSMRHQVELLFLVLKETVEARVPQLTLYLERDETRRRGPRKYALDRIAMAYQCFLLKNPEVQRESIVAQELAEGEILDSTEEFLNERFELFAQYLAQYAFLDDEVCRVYAQEDSSNRIPTGASWFGSETTLNSFFAALADFGANESRIQRVSSALKELQYQLGQATPGEDPLGLQTADRLVKDLNPRKTNIGIATRRLYFNAFKEYFREEGQKSMRDSWLAAAE